MTDQTAPVATPRLSWRPPTWFFKGATLAFLILALLLPLQMIRDLIGERADRQYQVAAEIAASWGPAQTILGPFLEVPVTTADNRDLVAKLLPAELTIEGDLQVQRKARGLYEALIYDTRLSFSASFPAEGLAGLGSAGQRLKGQEAQLVLLVSDLSGMEGAPTVTLSDGRQITFEPLATASGLIALKAKVPLKDLALLPTARFNLSLAGTSGFALAPAGRSLAVALTSNWPHPSFQGSALPRTSEIGDSGFSANWRLSHVNAAVPGAWLGASDESDPEISQLRYSAAELRLVQPVDRYAMSDRALKYGAFVLLLVFAAVFLFETLAKVPLHAMQYALLGFDMALFFLLLLSLAEVAGFPLAYTLAAGMTSGLATLYLKWSLQSGPLALALFATLAAIHGYLYVTLASEDFALLSGALALFLLLAGVMTATRRLDWRRLPQNSGVPS